MRRKTSREANAFTKFRLLMWKNFLQQWRHRTQTAVELLLPVLTMALVLILRWQLEPNKMPAINYPAIPAQTLNYSTQILAGMNFTSMTIAYSPESPVLGDIVETAVSNLLEDNAKDIICSITEQIIESFPDWPGIELLPTCDQILSGILPINNTIVVETIKNLIKVKPYNSSDALRGIYVSEDETRRTIAAVQFDDDLRGATSLPKHVSYALRFPERPRTYSFYSQGGRTWRSELVFPVFELPGPRFPYSYEGGNDPGYVNEMFIALQHVISSEIVSRLTNIDLHETFKVNIQRYPHPEYIEDLSMETLQLLFPSFIMLSFAYTAINIVRAVTVEKELQLKESMKIMGLPTWLHWTAWFFKQFIYLLFTTLLITIILKVNWFTNADGYSGYAVFTNTPWTVLIFYLLVYLSCTIFFCFMISGFFSKASTAALFTGLIWFLTNIPALLLFMDVQFSVVAQMFTCLCINSAMSYGFNLLIAKESTGGMQWGSFLDSPSAESSRFTFGHVVIMLFVDCVVYFLIALYLEQVLPGPYGTPKPWYFPLTKEFWLTSKKQCYENDAFENESNIDKPMEKDPNLPIGVNIKNLTKVYGNNTAVSNLSLNIYDDQITVLLGHNGAGKSTTISMLTGNVEITRGSVTLAGYDVARQAAAARAHLGLCPQHNVIFNALTVREHLKFFATLKGFAGRELDEEIDELIEKLELQDKRDYLAQGLSGGQKRRLCVGIALSGAAKVVLLDEPTSGMDPASRRALWDLLQKEKKGRSMILTTHFMDEADILGDRVAILAGGRLQCAGSPYFLKRHYGVGYTLVLVKGEGFRHGDATALVRAHIPGPVATEDRGSEVTYNLINEYSHLFENLLKDLENNQQRIMFKNYGLTATTLEDVFMTVGSDTPVNNDVDDATTCTDYSEDLLKYEFESSFEHLDQTEEDLTWLALTWQHIRATWLKLWLVWTRSWGIALLQMVIPFLILTMTLLVMKYMMSFIEGIQDRHLTLAKGYVSTESFLTYQGNQSSSLGLLARQAYGQMFEDAPAGMLLTEVDAPLDQYYLNRTSDPTAMGLLRNQLLTGASFTDSSATAWFSNFGYHDVATSLAAVHNALLKAVVPDAELTVSNHPLEAKYNTQNNIQIQVAMLSMQLSYGIGNSLSIVGAFFIMFYIRERASRAKLLQKAAGIQPAVLWGSAAVFDWAWFLIISLSVPIICVIFQVVGMNSFTDLGHVYVCLMIYGAAMLPLNYILSHLFSGPAVGFVVVFFCNVLLGLIGSQIVEALRIPMLDTEQVADGMDYVLQFFPLYSLVTSVRRIHTSSVRVESCLQSCRSLAAVLPTISDCNMDVMCKNFPSSCCVKDNATFDWEAPGVLRYLVAMIISFVILYAILMAMEYRLFHKIIKLEKRPPPLDPSSLDEDVAAEIKHVQMMDNVAIRNNRMSLIVKDLSKYYNKNLAVDQLSFSVSPGEIFGLLGVNGAGKTTTFKMLMGDERISSGDAYVAGYSVKRDLNQVHNNIGYCPQFDAVFGELTGRETLRLFAMLRGLNTTIATPLAVFLAQALGFTKHLDKCVDHYSGGNKRKLSTAIALLGRTRLVSVDEPTTGVDPAAKRQVWRALRGARAANRGILLTSHSMEECEALCSRLAIMVNGQFQCLGSPQHLKNRFSEGFTLTVKMKLDENSTEVEAATRALKDYISSSFISPKIIEEYQGLLTYYLPDKSVPWSKMFGIMERTKQELDVEDYNITQTTLEQIFLQFTKYQRE